MAKDFKVLPIKKVVAILSVFWTIAGTIMLLSTHYFTRSLIIVCSLIAVVPTILAWVLVFVSLHLDKQTEKRSTKRGARRSGAVGRTGKGKGIPSTSKRS